MKKTKCVFCIFVLLFSFVCILPIPSHAQEGTFGENLTWRFEDGCLTVSGNGPMPTDQNTPWMDMRGSITTVILEPGITSIAKRAFEGCSNLTSVSLPQGLLSIEDFAFHGCTKLAEITLPATLNKIGESAFAGCGEVDEVHISDISAWLSIAFHNEKSNPLASGAELYLNGELVEELVIPKGCEEVPLYAFVGCQSLRSVTIPKGVIRIQAFAFCRCENLRRVTIPVSVKYIANDVFADCDSLTSISYQGTPRQLAKVRIIDDSNDALLSARLSYSWGYHLWQGTLTAVLSVGFQLGLIWLILAIRRKRRGY